MITIRNPRENRVMSCSFLEKLIHISRLTPVVWSLEAPAWTYFDRGRLVWTMIGIGNSMRAIFVATSVSPWVHTVINPVTQAAMRLMCQRETAGNGSRSLVRGKNTPGGRGIICQLWWNGRHSKSPAIGVGKKSKTTKTMSTSAARSYGLRRETKRL